MKSHKLFVKLDLWEQTELVIIQLKILVGDTLIHMQGGAQVGLQ